MKGLLWVCQFKNKILETVDFMLIVMASSGKYHVFLRGSYIISSPSVDLKWQAFKAASW